MKTLVHVAVGVIEDVNKRILIARRPEHLHQGGLWEFPGGKVQQGEDVSSALRRELHEELGIEVGVTRPLIKIEHDYGDKQVLLDVHWVTRFSGEAHGREGQPVKWVSVSELDDHAFPAANRGIINAIRLPERYMITGEFANDAECVTKIERAVAQGVRLIQLRAHHLSSQEYLALAKTVLAILPAEVYVLLNTSVENFVQTDAAGLHLTSRRLMQHQQRPVADNKLLSASVHNELELAQAQKLGVDLILVSPVLTTSSHPAIGTLGWQRFAELVALANCPVYALGGMQLTDIADAHAHGGQGIAGIKVFWSQA